MSFGKISSTSRKDFVFDTWGVVRQDFETSRKDFSFQLNFKRKKVSFWTVRIHFFNIIQELLHRCRCDLQSWRSSITYCGSVTNIHCAWSFLNIYCSNPSVSNRLFLLVSLFGRRTSSRDATQSTVPCADAAATWLTWLAVGGRSQERKTINRTLHMFATLSTKWYHFYFW